MRDLGTLWLTPAEAAGVKVVGTSRDGTEYTIHRTDPDGSVRVPRYLPAFDGWEPRTYAYGDELTTLIKLRPSQIRPAKAALKALVRNRGCFYNDRCGGGKTVVALWARAVLGLRKTVVMVDQMNLLEQWAARVHEHVGKQCVVGIWSNRPNFLAVRKKTVGELVHLRTAEDARAHDGIVIVITQSLLGKTLDVPIYCDLLVVDEAHTFSAPHFCQTVYCFDFVHSLALSANAVRKDGQEWIFKAFLGADAVVGKGGGRTQAAVIIQWIDAETIMPMGHYGSFWCRRMRAQTSRARCDHGDLVRKDGALFTGGCPYYGSFPSCGGDPKGGGRMDAWSLLDDVYSDPAYRKAVITWVTKFMEKGRNAYVFSQTVPFAKLIHTWAVRKFGEDKVGLYVRNMKGAKAVAALGKQLTITTAAKAQKGLDVPEKDALLWALGSGDFPQVIGRIERTLPGKPTPVAVVLRPKSVHAWRNKWAKEQDAFLDKRGYRVSERGL